MRTNAFRIQSEDAKSEATVSSKFCMASFVASFVESPFVPVTTS